MKRPRESNRQKKTMSVFVRKLSPPVKTGGSIRKIGKERKKIDNNEEFDPGSG